MKNKIILKNSITQDKYTKYVFEKFDIQNKEETIVEIPINFNECKKFDWNIGVIYGGSGSGKTTLLNQFGNISNIKFNSSVSLISNFDFVEPEEATMLLSAMGLASVPTWLRPFHTLSNGEKYRAELAYKVGKAKDNELILIDEYTSVVDRDVAKAMSNALQKYIKRHNKRIILASCHFDIMDWLQPCWIYSPLKSRVERTDYRRQRPSIELQIFRCRYETWNLFKKHHYLTEKLSKSAKSFVILQNEKPICFIGILPHPSGTVKNAFRVSRLVVLPDYQGLGIGMKILTLFGSMYRKDKKTLYIKTSNPSLFKGMERNTKDWMQCKKSDNVKKTKEYNKKLMEKGHSGLKLFKESITKSFKYIGQEHKGNIDVIIFNSDCWKNISQNQIKLFND